MATAQVVSGRPARSAAGIVVEREGRVHRLPAHGKLVALVAFVLTVVATPARAWWAFAGYAVLLGATVAVARMPWRFVATRLLVETPFVVFALLMPLVATGPRVEVLGVSLSRAGLTGGALLLAKATLGVVAAVVLAGTTGSRELLAGLERLRIPATLVAILSFMLRYVSVVSADLQRMRVARESRGYSGGRLGHLRHVAASVGSLFVRSYERGERVHLAMVARGYRGRMPIRGGAASARDLATCALLPAAAAAVLAVAWLWVGTR